MKKLIFCFDGTSNSPEDLTAESGDKGISNILKLHLFFGGQLPASQKSADLVPQRSFYYSGIGTRGSWLKRLFNSAFAPKYGEMDDIIAQARVDLDNNFAAGDEIYLFGFSRGAAIARMFAARLSLPIKFLGVFDTVAATRGSLDLNPNTFPASGIVFENDTLAEHVEKAVHLVAIDEQRVLFQPTLFNKDERVKEVWFAGVHSDIGGGYRDDGLADICLDFMLNEVNGLLNVMHEDDFHYLTLLFNNEHLVINPKELQISPHNLGDIHHTKARFSRKLLYAPRVIRVNVNEAVSPFLPIIHYSVVERIQEDVGYRPESLKAKHYNVINNLGQLNEIRFAFDQQQKSTEAELSINTTS